MIRLHNNKNRIIGKYNNEIIIIKKNVRKGGRGETST